MKSRIYKMVKQLAGTLRQELRADSRLVIFVLDPFSGQLEPCWPRNDVPVLTEPSAELLRMCLKRERSILIRSRTDPFYPTHGHGDFEAALCVPLLDLDRNAVGVIYADHKEPLSFENTERLNVERAARGLSGALPKKGELAPQSPVEVADAPFWMSRPLQALTAVAAVFLAFWLLSPADPPSTVQAPATPVATWDAAPEAVARTYLQLLASREYEQAWQLLHPDLRKSLPFQAFRDKVSTWLSDGSHRWELPRRTVRKGQVGVTEAVCLIDPDPEMSELGPWRWTLRREGKAWRLAALEGGP